MQQPPEPPIEPQQGQLSPGQSGPQPIVHHGVEDRAIEDTPPASDRLQTVAGEERKPRAEKGAAGESGALHLFIDKAVDFLLVFVGLYAAIAVQRYQDTDKEKDEYILLLKDFKREVKTNLEQEASIVRDLGAIEDSLPGKNLGPMSKTFTRFFGTLKEDENVIACLHDEFLVARRGGTPEHPLAQCHESYKQFDQDHQKHAVSFSFKPVVLTPFYRREVWQLYLANGVKTFRNKELAVHIAKIYSGADRIDDQVQDIEQTYNEAFMKQVGRTAATDSELAEIVHDEEREHGLSKADVAMLTHVDEAIKGEHYGALEVQRILELKVERMKKTVLLMRTEIQNVQKAIDGELAKVDG